MERLTEREPYWLGEEFWTSAKEPGEEEIDKVYEKLKYYEDLEEQGKLLKLPCKVGDEIFIPIDFQGKVHHGVIIGVEYSKIRKSFVAVVRTDDDFLCYEKFEDFGKTAFLNRNQAEEALKKMIERNRYKHE
ncbi:MAG: hypothetical protein KHY96_01350 [Lachnospiraceae bacterium]|nr:hypothetical protein [Lachnospiraceae bacterium]